jgi:hypothetical protein
MMKITLKLMKILMQKVLSKISTVIKKPDIVISNLLIFNKKAIMIIQILLIILSRELIRYPNKINIILIDIYIFFTFLIIIFNFIH